MSWLQLAEGEAEAILEALKARCEYLFSGFGANSHAHLDHIVTAIQDYVNAKSPVQAPSPSEETASAAPAEPAVASVAAATPAESAPVVAEEQTPVITPQG